jgi:malate synthase
MKYEILNDSGEVINTIVADQDFVDTHYPERYRVLAEDPITVNAHLSVEVRKKRDDLLKESDWVVVKAFETNTAIPANWATYRQALRDIPQQTDFPSNVIWPELVVETVEEVVEEPIEGPAEG